MVDGDTPPAHTDLDGRWTLREQGERAGVVCAADVPGSVHDALHAAGIIPDPLVSSRETELEWVSRRDWTFVREFHVKDPSEWGDLCLDGVDTFSSVVLNGTVLGTTANQHRSYRFPVANVLRAGSNVIEVRLRSSLNAAREQEAMLGPRPHLFDLPFNAVRKMAANFGWDWGPVLVTSGIWRSVRLEAKMVARVAGVRVATLSADPERVHASIEVDVHSHEAGLKVTAMVAGETVVLESAEGSSVHRAEADLSGVALWWPIGEGAQTLYDVSIEVRDRNNTVVATASRRVGFRTVSVDFPVDEHGVGFAIRVNDRRIHVRGANWIPADVLSPERTDIEYAQLLRSAVNANMNLIRIWGGGVYEAEAFYRECDELGLLVWQDFMFACAAYSEAPELAHEVEAEAREALTRLSTHPSVALWCGSNENLWGHDDWNWAPELQGASWGEHYYRSLLPSLVSELAPTTPYVPSSPFSTQAVDQNAPADALHHAWDIWNHVDYEGYSKDAPRFVSEFGFQGPASWTVLARGMGNERVGPSSPSWHTHQKAVDGHRKLADSVEAHFGRIDSVERWHWAAQLNQGHAISYALRWYRSLAPHNSGAIVWQLNDCWPAFSWAMVDHAGYRKPAWYASRAANAAVIISSGFGGEGVGAHLSNVSSSPRSVALHVRRMTMDGTVLAETRTTVSVDAHSSAPIALGKEMTNPEHPEAEVLVFEAADENVGRWIHYFVPDRLLEVVEGSIEVSTRRDQDDWIISVFTGVLLKDLWLQTDRLGADISSDQGYVTLLPGESYEFRVRGVEHLSENLAFPTLSSANDVIPTTSGAKERR